MELALWIQLLGHNSALPFIKLYPLKQSVLIMKYNVFACSTSGI